VCVLFTKGGAGSLYKLSCSTLLTDVSSESIPSKGANIITLSIFTDGRMIAYYMRVSKCWLWVRIKIDKLARVQTTHLFLNLEFWRLIVERIGPLWRKQITTDPLHVITRGIPALTVCQNYISVLILNNRTTGIKGYRLSKAVSKGRGLKLVFCNT